MSQLVHGGAERRLTALEFQQLAAFPAAVEWFANIDNPRTRREPGARFSLARPAGIARPSRRKLAALASLFDHLLENNAIAGGNPVTGVKEPRVESN